MYFSLVLYKACDKKASAPLLNNFHTAQANAKGKNTTDATISHRPSVSLARSFKYLGMSEACMRGFHGVSV